jgi:hypothetical protein
MMTLQELEEAMEQLPNQDPQFLIGWLMSQVVWLMNVIEEKENEEA